MIICGKRRRNGRQTLNLGEWGCLQGAPLVKWWQHSPPHATDKEPHYDPSYANQGPVDNHI